MAYAHLRAPPRLLSKRREGRTKEGLSVVAGHTHGDQTAWDGGGGGRGLLGDREGRRERERERGKGGRKERKHAVREVDNRSHRNWAFPSRCINIFCLSSLIIPYNLVQYSGILLPSFLPAFLHACLPPSP